MAWNPEQVNSYAWVTKTASEHGGVESYLNDIKREAFEQGRQKGIKETVTTIIATLGSLFILKLLKEIYCKIKKNIQLKKKMQKKSCVAESNDSTNTAKSHDIVNNLQRGGVNHE